MTSSSSSCKIKRLLLLPGVEEDKGVDGSVNGLLIECGVELVLGGGVGDFGDLGGGERTTTDDG